MPGSSARPLPVSDLDHVMEHTRGLWDDLRGARLFVTGGTGFFGRWMVETFLRANEDLALGASAILLTRDPRRAAQAAPHLGADPAIHLQAGDVRTFELPHESLTHVLHLATEAGPDLTSGASFRTAVHGTERVLDLAARTGARKMLFTSSGAVYGPQPNEMERISEEFTGAPAPEDAYAGYGHGKRAAEYLCAVAAQRTSLEVKVARCFAFVGPLLPLDLNFAIGNFLRDALERDRIDVSGDGTARRSYLYAADLAIWLWTILVNGTSMRPYNVGSETDVSISELARLVAQVVRPGTPVHVAEIADERKAPSRYVPSTARAASDLGLRPMIALEESVRRTANWYRA